MVAALEAAKTHRDDRTRTTLLSSGANHDVAAVAAAASCQSAGAAGTIQRTARPAKPSAGRPIATRQRAGGDRRVPGDRAEGRRRAGNTQPGNVWNAYKDHRGKAHHRA